MRFGVLHVIHRGSAANGNCATRPEITAITETVRGKLPHCKCYYCAFAGYGNICRVSSRGIARAAACRRDACSPRASSWAYRCRLRPPKSVGRRRVRRGNRGRNA